jgi:ABC-type branched-subunit amino acid transport system substrate-binding protein
MKKLLGSLATVAVGVTVLAGCGSGAGAASKTIDIGFSVPLSGPIASTGFAQACGFKAYIDAENKAGGINGYTIKVNQKDNQYDPATAASIARGFATGGKTFATYVVGSATSEASLPVLQPRNIPMFATADGALYSPPKWKGEFGYFPDYSDEAASAANFVTGKLGATKVAHVYFGGAVGATSVNKFKDGVQAAGGQDVLDQEVPATTTDFTPIAQKLKDANAPVVYAQLVDAQIAGLQKAAAAIGYNPKWVMWNISYGSTYLSLAGKLAVGNYVSQWAWPVTQESEPTVKTFLDDMKAEGGKCAGQIYESNAATGYGVAAAMSYGIQQATKGGAKPTVDSFISDLSFSNKPMGTTPQMTYSSDSHAGVSANSYWKVTSTAQGGSLKLAQGFTPLPK